MINEILLRRKNKIFINEEQPVGSEHYNSSRLYVSTIMKNIENLGYTFSSELRDRLCNYSEKRLGNFYLELVEVLKDKRGANVQYNPMYPNFPKEVMSADDCNLYINAVIHYLSGGMLFPNIKKEERLPLFEEGNIEILDLGTEDELWNIFVDLINSKSSLSNTDKEDLEWFFKNYGYKTLDFLPEKIPYKENVGLVCKLWLQYVPMFNAFNMDKYVKTATDVLRIAVAMSDGDISLASPCHFRSFSRRERRTLLRLLEEIPKESREKDMVKYRERWCRLDYFLHSNEKRMKELYPSTAKSFKKMHNKKHIPTYNSETNNLVNNVLEEIINPKELIEHLKERPGEFGRSLDFLLRVANTEKLRDEIVDGFKSCADKISTTVLLQIREHFRQRNSGQKYRVFFPKGQVAKAYNIKNELEPIKSKYCHEIANICEEKLIDQYSERDPMGKVYLADEYKNYTIPFSQRSASKSFKTISRGSRIPINKNCNTIRGFIWWTNINDINSIATWNDRVDIDLSAVLYDEDWNYKTHVSFTDLKDNEYHLFHSGDITNGGPKNGKGAAEFIDVDINVLLTKGIRYVVYQVYDYTRHSFSELPHAMFGWMERENPNSGEIFEPKTVNQKIDLTVNSTGCLPVIFDLKNKEFVWADMSIPPTIGYGTPNCLENHLGTLQSLCYSVVNMSKTNLYDLITFNVIGRGDFVEEKEEADIVFDIDEGITPCDTEIFLGEYL